MTARATFSGLPERDVGRLADKKAFSSLLIFLQPTPSSAAPAWAR